MDTPDPVTTQTPFAVTVSRPERLFPKLTPAQLARITSHGRRRATSRSEVLVDVGDRVVPCFVVVAGEIQALQVSDGAETLIVSHGPGSFTGEANLISGRPSMARLRVSEPGEVIELSREQLLALVQTDAELSEILMRAFILRRLELIARDVGGVVVIGSTHNAGTLRIREFLTRNGHPFHFIDLDRDADAQELLDRFHVDAADVPVLICGGETVLRNPTNAQIADCLGFNETVDQTRVNDLVVVGAGPAGLAAAVYGASEGLSVLVLESNVPGGQAGSSSRIENYLGFPTGISGLDLTGRAYAQALKFGAQVMVAKGATRLACDGQRYTVEIDGGPKVLARAVIIATGAEYRKPALENLSMFEGAGVYYGATPMEAQLCLGEEVVDRRRRQFGRTGRGVSRADHTTRPHAGPQRRTGGHHVPLSDSPDRRDAIDRAADPYRDCRLGRGRTARADPVARRANRRHRDARHPPRVHDDRGGPQHALARWMYRPR